MLNWIKQALGGVRGLENTYRYGPEILKPLAQDLSRLSKRGDSLPAKALTFIVDGKGGDVPALIRQTIAGHYTWTSHDLDREARQIRWKLYDHWDAVTADFWVRFGSILAADSPTLNHSQALNIAQQHPWVEALALDLAGLPVSHGSGHRSGRRSHPTANVARLEKLLESVGLQRSSLVVSTFQSPAKRSIWVRSAEFIATLPGFQESVVRDASLVRGAFRDKAFENRLYALRLLSDFDSAGLQPFAEELVALSLESSGQVRAAAVPLALRAGPAALEIAQREALTQKPEARTRALQLLWRSSSESARSFVRERGSSDPAESVRKALEALIACPTAEETQHKTEIQLRDVRVDTSRALSDDACEELRLIFRRHNELIRERRAKTDERWKTNWRETTREGIEQIVSQVARHEDGTALQPVQIQAYPVDTLIKLITQWARRDEVTLAHLVRLLISIDWISSNPSRDARYVISPQAGTVLCQFGRIPGRASLLRLDELIRIYGVSPEAIPGKWFSARGTGIESGWSNDDVWPYFAAHREVIAEALDPASPKHSEYWYNKQRVFDALATFPQPPADLVPALFELGLGSAKSDRAGAQRVLDRHPDKAPRIIEALKSGKSDARIAAATWLARLRIIEAVAPLQTALAKEKHPGAAGAMMSALELIGVPVDRLLNREGLLKEAQDGIKKGIPVGLEWFPFDGLPDLHWRDSRERLPVEIGRWWIIQGFKLKNPEPIGVMKQYFVALQPACAEAFGLYVLQAWLKEDVRPIPQTEAEKQARAQARQMMQYIKQYPSGYSDAQRAMTEEQFYELYLPRWIKRPAGSAAGSKGVLAVVAAGGGSEIAPQVHRYLKEWYGTRASQGKSLIQMLAWVDHPAATQLVLSIGSRFRTKGFQEEATRQAQLLAERNNWTLDELADRTIPTAGFDADGTAEIDYGIRKFTARLTAEFEIELFSSDGKRLATLPDARKDEDEQQVKDAKKYWSSAKKELKGVLQLQKARLYEALCTQRTWKSEDWHTYLNQHPIVAGYCRRLVWVATDSARRRLSFRPLDDGSLTDLDDKPVSFESSTVISLAHDSTVPEMESRRWLKHFEDYKVDPLFQQFGKGIYRLPEEQNEATEIEDFKGHVLEAFALRGRATKLGYTRGAAQDGGWFLHYEKRFPTLGLEACIEFTGNSLPEQNRRVALLALSFVRRDQQGEEQTQLPLSEVPKVLLSECWNDMRLIAAEGSGFDPEWEKSTEQL